MIAGKRCILEMSSLQSNAGMKGAVNNAVIGVKFDFVVWRRDLKDAVESKDHSHQGLRRRRYGRAAL